MEKVVIKYNIWYNNLCEDTIQKRAGMDNKKALSNMMRLEDRYKNFSDLLLELKIVGVKGTNCTIEFDFPVTAISGCNGAGKSTIAQIALCAYKGINPSDAQERFYLKDFFVKTLLDKQPYLPTAEIYAKYAVEKSDIIERQLSFFKTSKKELYEKQIKLYYAGDRWAGYRNQPMRKVYYYGMSYFIPYQEQNSNLLGDHNARVSQTYSFKKEIVDTVADILSIQYSNLQHNNIQNDKREEQVISASKGSVIYSENHMGCGEGRLLKLVDALENAPDRSLLVIEEPETALHQHAQYRLSIYFMDVCCRKRHQIIFTTHSSDILKALPLNARKLLIRREEETQIIDGPTIPEVEQLFSKGFYKGLTIATEDKIGELYLKEILRKYAPRLFQNVAIWGLELAYKDIKSYVESARKCNFKVCGVVDENRLKEPKKFIGAFPENTAPEVSFFNDGAVIDFLKQNYHYDVNQLTDDHHDYFEKVSKTIGEELVYIEVECIKRYVASKDETYYKELIEWLENWLSD